MREAALLGMLALFVVVSVNPDVELPAELRAQPASTHALPPDEVNHVAQHVAQAVFSTAGCR